MAKKNVADEACIAYHEAGHAVIAYRLGRRLVRATIVANDDYLGAVTYGPWGKGSPDCDLSARTVAKLERDILVAYAGAIAEKKYSGRDNHAGASSDNSRIVDRASYMHGGGKVLDAYLDYMYERAVCHVAEPCNWLCISRLAKQLLTRRTMSRTAVVESILESSELFRERRAGRWERKQKANASPTRS